MLSPPITLEASRLVRYLGGIALTLGVAFACSNDPAALPTGFVDPATLAISSVSLSKGNVLIDGSTQLACDHTIGVALDIGNWDLRQPGACPVTQCGRVRLQLSNATRTWVDQEFASSGISLDLRAFFPADAEPLLTAGTYTLTAALINDAGNPYNPSDLGSGSDSVSFPLDLPPKCESGAGGAGAGGSGPVAEGGAAGLAGAPGNAGAGGDVGGEAGTSGAGGASDSGGTAGTSGTSGGSGAGGTSGAGDTAGGAGTGGARATAGTAGA